jgi:hypothetical protein
MSSKFNAVSNDAFIGRKESTKFSKCVPNLENPTDVGHQE